MANEDTRRTWTDNAAGWVENAPIIDAVFGPVTVAIVEAAAFRPGGRVLDVGCGSGTLLARAVDAGAVGFGIDISSGMVAAAQRRVPAATIVVGDAQTDDLVAVGRGAPFDLVVSRFGVMFFADPGAAFANIRAATAPGGRIVFACWRTKAENAMFSLGTDVLVDRLPVPPEPPEPHAPGPTALADGARTEAILASAGWSSIGVRALDFECDYGFADGDGVDERLAAILGSTIGRTAREQLEPALGPDGWASLLDDVRIELKAHLVDGAVRFPGAAWLVTATNPE